MGKQPTANRRNVLKSVAGIASAGVLSHGLGSTAAQSGDDPQDWCGGNPGGDVEQNSATTDGTCSSTDPWPDVIEDHDSVKSVDYPAAAVMHMEAGGPITYDDWTHYDNSPMADNCLVDVDPGDQHRVAIFFAELYNGYRGFASDRYTIKDSGTTYLPDGEDEADAYIVLDKQNKTGCPPGESICGTGAWADARVGYHEIGHTLGYQHFHCGLMDTAEERDADYFGNTSNAGYLDRDCTIEIAKRANGIHYIDEVTRSDVNDIIIPMYINDDVPYAEVQFWDEELEPNGDPVVYLESEWTFEFGGFVIRLDGYDTVTWDDWYRGGSYLCSTWHESGWDFPILTSPWDIHPPGSNLDWPNWDQNNITFGVAPSQSLTSCDNKW